MGRQLWQINNLIYICIVVSKINSLTACVAPLLLALAAETADAAETAEAADAVLGGCWAGVVAAAAPFGTTPA